MWVKIPCTPLLLDTDAFWFTGLACLGIALEHAVPQYVLDYITLAALCMCGVVVAALAMWGAPSNSGATIPNERGPRPRCVGIAAGG